MTQTIKLSDPRLLPLLDSLKLKNPDHANLCKLFEETYNCKIYIDDPFCTTGHVVLEGKYLTWFLLQNE